MSHSLLLIHGLASNELMFFYPTQVTLGKLLSTKFNIYLARLRHGRPNKFFPEWNFEDYLYHDIRKIWLETLTLSETKPAVLGYSLGGMLALIAQALNIIDAPQIIAIASPFLFQNIPFYPQALSYTQRFLSFSKIRQLPLRLLGKLIVWYFAKLNPTNIKNKYLFFLKQIHKFSINLPYSMLNQITDWLKLGYLYNQKLKINYFNLLKNIKTPILIIGGKKDVIAPPNVLYETYNIISKNNSKNNIYILDKADHVNITFGSNAKLVFTTICNWLLNN